MFPVYQFLPQNQTSHLQLASTSLQSLKSPGNISLQSAFTNTTYLNKKLCKCNTVHLRLIYCVFNLKKGFLASSVLIKISVHP